MSFETLRNAASQLLSGVRAPPEHHAYSVVGQCREVLKHVEQQQPDWPEQLRRVVAGAMIMPRIRAFDAHVREHILLLWLMQGERFLRRHRGTCYLYNEAGAFQAYRGCPSEQTVARVKEFILQLEGFLKLMPAGTNKDGLGIVNAAESLLTDEGGNVQALLDAFTAAAVFAEASPRNQRRSRAAEHENALAAPAIEWGDWSSSAAQVVNKLSLILQKEVMDDKIYALLNEWCETPHMQEAGVAYVDCCTMYDRVATVSVVPPHPKNNIYLFIPHRLRPSLADPVLQAATKRLEKFFQETFWLNNDVFACCQAAQALAKRGFNIDRCFIGISPGGVGQSLYSAHLNAVYCHNHAFIDPNIWYDDQELRKQVEQFASCIILTAQEAPETSKRMREDLYKKTMSGDGIAGRRPYGYVTRMIELSGWKRMEVNRLMPFKGVNESNFPSILRRSFVWKPRARFANPEFLRKFYPDAHLNGVFPKDSALKDFLVSGPAVASSLQLQFGFELEHTREQCLQMIEDYVVLGGDLGLTEEKMRGACGLQLRDLRPSAVAGLGAEDSSQETQAKQAQLQLVQEALMEHCFSKHGVSCTQTMFAYVKLPPAEKIPNLAKSELWKTLQQEKCIRAVPGRPATKEHFIPCLTSAKTAKYLALPENRRGQASFPEVWDLARLRDYALGHSTREHNITTMIACHDAALRLCKKRGRKSEQEKMNCSNLEEFKASLENCECKIAEFLSAATSFDASSQSQAATPRQRQGSKRPPTLLQRTTYHCKSSLGIRGRRYAGALSAQGCPSRLLFYMYGNSTDLDIANAFFSIMHQFLEKLDISGDWAKQAVGVMKQCATQRKQLCLQQLEVSEAIGKSILLQVIHGGVPPVDVRDKELVRQLQRTSLYLKWIAINACPEVYATRVADAACANPDSSVLALVYQAIEDYILDAWLQYLMQHDFSHLSLHCSTDWSDSRGSLSGLHGAHQSCNRLRCLYPRQAPLPVCGRSCANIFSQGVARRAHGRLLSRFGQLRARLPSFPF